MNEFVEQFLIESRELVDQATDDLLALEQDPADRARLDSVFRAFHTLKGGAGIVDFFAMGRLLHAAEDVLASVRAGEAPVTVDLISRCLSCLDQVVQWLNAMEDSGELPTDVDAAADLLAAQFGASTAEPVAAPTGPPDWVGPLVASAPEAWNVRTALRYTPDAGCFFRGEDPLALVARIPGLLALRLHPSVAWPPLDELDAFACSLVVEALFSAGPDVVGDHLRTVSDQVRVQALPGDGETAGGLSERARSVLQAQIALASAPGTEGFAGRLGSAAQVARHVLAHAGRGDRAASIAAALVDSLAAGDAGALVAALSALVEEQVQVLDPPDEAAAATQGVVTRALRVDVERIDAIVRLTGELTVVKNAIGHAARLAGEGVSAGLGQILKDQHALLERLTVDLQSSAIAIRVLPLRHVFQRFARLVREMTASGEKSARLILEGEDTEADKGVVEALFEPLLHVIRNAVDHGVESPAERRTAGKSETASIRMRGFREGERVIIEVRDDGRGIDAGAVRRVAADRGLMGAEGLAAMPDDETLELIFAPGFSTAAFVTERSGRGVGMDAVRSTIERVGGRVSIESAKGQGTTVRFTLPFTVMMTQVMVVEAGGQVFGVPFEAVVETLQVPRDEVTPIGAAEALVLRGRTAPLVSLREALGLAPIPDRPNLVRAVVTDSGGQLSALEVDGFGERLDVMLKPMEGLLAGMRGLAGTTLMGDGRVLIVLDLQALLQ